MADTVYALDYTVTDDVNNRNMNIGPFIPGAGLPQTLIPLNTRAKLVIRPNARARSAIDGGADPNTIGLEIIPDTPNQFGMPIIQTQQIAGTYTYAQLAKGFTKSTLGSAVQGSAVAFCIFGSILTYQSGQFELVDLPGQLIVGGTIKGKPGYRRGRFT